MKKIFKFQLKDILIGCSIYGLILLLLAFISVGIILTNGNIKMSLSGNSFVSVIFCLSIGIGIYKEHCQMAVMNSVSRKDFFKSFLCITILTSLLCTLIDLILLIISQMPMLRPSSDSGFIYNSAFIEILEIFYPGFFETRSATVITAAGFLLEILTNSGFFLLGALTAGIYCRMPKKFRTIYCIMLPIFGFVILPLFFAAISFSPQSPGRLVTAFLQIMGISSGNPFLGALSVMIASAAIAFICYRILRRTEIV